MPSWITGLSNNFILLLHTVFLDYAYTAWNKSPRTLVCVDVRNF